MTEVDVAPLVWSAVIAAVVIVGAVARRRGHRAASQAQDDAVRGRGWSATRNRGRLNGMWIHVDGTTDRGHRFRASKDTDPESIGITLVEFTDLRPAVDLPSCTFRNGAVKFGRTRTCDSTTTDRLEAAFDAAPLDVLTRYGDGTILLRRTRSGSGPVIIHLPDGSLATGAIATTVDALDALVAEMLGNGLIQRTV